MPTASTAWRPTTSADVQATPTAAQATITLISPPTPPKTADGPEVTEVLSTGIGERPRRYVLTFQRGPDPATAQDANNYQIVSLTGRKFRMKSAVYNAAALTVTLHPRKRSTSATSTR